MSKGPCTASRIRDELTGGPLLILTVSLDDPEVLTVHELGSQQHIGEVAVRSDKPRQRRRVRGLDEPDVSVDSCGGDSSEN